MTKNEPKLDDKFIKLLKRIRENCVGYKRYTPPSKTEITKLRGALKIILQSFEDEELAPYIGESLLWLSEEAQEETLNIPYTIGLLSTALEHADIPERRGRKNLPLWVYMNTSHLIDYYEGSTKEKAALFFLDDDANMPNNPFSN